MKKNNFEYNVPFKRELEEMYLTPYKFSDELRAYVDYMFLHPKHNKYHKVYSEHYNKWRSNDMLKLPYLILRYYLDYPQQFAHNVENVLPHCIKAMWKKFLAMEKEYNGVKFEQYYPAKMSLLCLAKGQFLDIFLKDIESINMVMHPDDMVKRREGVGLRERRIGKRKGRSKRYQDYLCSL